MNNNIFTARKTHTHTPISICATKNWFSFWQNENTIYGKIRYNNLINAKPVQKNTVYAVLFLVWKTLAQHYYRTKKERQKKKKKLSKFGLCLDCNQISC